MNSHKPSKGKPRPFRAKAELDGVIHTSPALADRLIDLACEILSVDRSEQLFVEPSAGSRAFSSQLPRYLAYDLAPEGPGIEQADFLSLEPGWGRDTVAIGSSPFGKRTRLAIEFVNRCASSCSAVTMALPNTFRRYNTQARLDGRLALVLDEDLPTKGAFTFEGGALLPALRVPGLGTS